jgi:hypothetical protein
VEVVAFLPSLLVLFAWEARNRLVMVTASHDGGRQSQDGEDVDGVHCGDVLVVEKLVVDWKIRCEFAVGSWKLSEYLEFECGGRKKEQEDSGKFIYAAR